MSINFYLMCAIFAIGAYLLGGVNGAILLSKTVYGQDIRELGSGNPGFSNFKRVYGMNAVSAIVMVSDIIKAAIPVFIAYLVFGAMFGMPQFGAAFTGLFAMIGHCLPVWYNFKGGKAFLCGFGTIWFVDWRMALMAAAVFFIVLGLTRYMSAASCISSLSCPFALAFLGAESAYVLVICAISALLIIVRHKENIKRLAHGTESKFTLGK